MQYFFSHFCRNNVTNVINVLYIKILLHIIFSIDTFIKQDGNPRKIIFYLLKFSCKRILL